MCSSFNGSRSKQVAHRRRSSAPLQWPTCTGTCRLRFTTVQQRPDLLLGARGGFRGGCVFSPISSELRGSGGPLFCFSGRQEEKKRMENGGICKLYHHQRRRRGVSHRLSVKECVPPFSPTHTQRILNGSLSFDTHWPARYTLPTQSHTNI